jgi:fatty-acyl-CoA synthase
MSLARRLSKDFAFVRDFSAPLLIVAQNAPNKTVSYSDLLESHFTKRANRPALIGESSSMTWGELDSVANRVANWARSAGLVRGDVVALLMENRPEYIAIWLGLSRVGVVTALLNTNLTGDRLAHCFREADAGYLIVGEELASGAASVLPFLETQPQVMVASNPGPIDPATEAVLPDALSFDEAIDAQPTTAIPEPLRADRRGSDGLFLIYTSGTTGLPKAARVSHSKAISAGAGAWKIQKLTPNDRMYICLPLYHSAGGMMAAGAGLFSGGALILAKRFSSKRFWSDCAQHDVTAFQYIGELCRYLLNSPPHPDERSHKLRRVIGNGLRPEVWGPFQKRFAIPRIIEFYGATEGNMVLFNLDGREGAIGYLPSFLRKVLGIEIARFDIDSEELVMNEYGRCIPAKTGEAGELLMKITGTSRFEGYTDAAASEKKILRDGFVEGDSYFRSGDLLRCDDEGYFYFVDRIGDTFRWKGENVSTNEVAEVISVVDGVDDANVYGVEVAGADGRAGMAALVTSEGFDIEAFGRCVEEELAVYARPLFVRLLSEMDITGTFKHRKVDLVKEGFDPTTLTDALYFRDPEKKRYVPLDAATHDRIVRGEIRV